MGGAWGPFAPLPIWGKKRKGQRLQDERKLGGETPQKPEGGKEREKWGVGGGGGTDEDTLRVTLTLSFQERNTQL